LIFCHKGPYQVVFLTFSQCTQQSEFDFEGETETR